jgi:hypothetical protein
MYEIIIAQVFAILAGIFYLLEDQSNDNKKILIYNGISNLFIAIEYFLLGAFTGGICNLVAILRNIYIHNSKEKVHIVVLISYFLFLIAVNFSSFNSWISVLPVLLVMMYTAAINTKKVKLIKYAVIVAYALEIIYDIYYMAYISVVICIAGIITAIIALKKIKE